MKVILIGDGGHSKVIREMIFAAGNYQVISILDDKYSQEFDKHGIVYGPLSLLGKYIDKRTKFVIAIGNNKVRKRLASSLPIDAEQYLTVVDPTAVISKTANIGQGTVVMPHAVINAESTVGNHCIINTGSIVEHENIIHDFAHISPNATLTGNVFIGEGVHIGASATVIPGKKIGSWSVIGAGAAVIHSIPAYSKAVGCPARIIQQNLNLEEKVVVVNDKK